MSEAGGRELEEAWVRLLASVYASVDWRRMRGRNPLDVFEHRVRFASYEPTLGRFLDRLMNTLSLQAPRQVYEAIDAVQVLRSREVEAMDYLRGNLKLLVYLAYSEARKLKRSKRRLGGEQREGGEGRGLDEYLGGGGGGQGDSA